eukprot:CAMPEP_0198270296 /NCGR_PEP_ID=MMETSP1447-20131203/44535_1 /TAXON_ID=420782 /ORGANISM="Chaetoceros dichaeta, Strain CCMP1751" /LENGTH=402 /DNA_ID=CAMNT_0043962251 /DNA_START=10 /DNA_END=1218 /DNA_ORIENTATION=-
MTNLPKGTKGLNIAVLGTGIAGSTASRYLAEAGIKVTVFECGRGIGGRTSTRITRDEHRLSFDHGAQYIGRPKTEEFRVALEEWETNGFIKKWNGKFVNVDIMTSSENALISPEDPDKEHYVGYPAMHSICRNLLHHQNIRVVLQTRACATCDNSVGGGPCSWNLISQKGRKDLGTFDWLVGSDRLSATNNRADMRSAPLDAFKDYVSSIESVPSLTLMVAFESPLKGINLDGINFMDTNDDEGSILGWAARDTSKPGRARQDGKECWVVQSNPKIAKKLITKMNKKGNSFESTRENVKDKAKEMLLAEFLRVLPKISDDSGTMKIPKVISAVGHRWSAAFPIVSQQGGEDKCFTDFNNRFVACGDYCGKYTGRIEGAFLSGKAAADTIISEINTNDNEEIS